jgi:hypothetical protein
MTVNFRAIFGLLAIFTLGAAPVLAMPRGDPGVYRAGDTVSAPSGCWSTAYNPGFGQSFSYQLCNVGFPTKDNWPYGVLYDVSSTNYYSPMQGLNGTVLNWRYPSTCPVSGVCGYSRVQLGGIYQTDAEVGNPGTPVQYSSMKELFAEIDITLTPLTTISSNTILCEYYSSTSATSVQNNPVNSTNPPRTKEVAFWPRYSTGPGSADANWATATHLGSFDDRNGISWEVRYGGNYYVARRADGTQMDRAFLDIKAYVTFLIGKGVLSSSEYIHGYACGIEQIGNPGSARINHFTFVKR